MPNDESPATRQDLKALEERLTETMRDMQTEMLRAFHNWADPQRSNPDLWALL